MEHAAIRLEAGGKTPFYEQLYAYFAAAIRSGALAPGERLPSKRRLAQDVGVSVSTVETPDVMCSLETFVTVIFGCGRGLFFCFLSAASGACFWEETKWSFSQHSPACFPILEI